MIIMIIVITLIIIITTIITIIESSSITPNHHYHHLITIIINSVTIGGNWGNYRSRILQYFQQLAVITPYAKLSLDFQCHRDNKKSFHADFDRRSDQMPPAAIEILPHPKSLNNITLSNLLQMKKSVTTTITVSSTIEQFLMKKLSGISSSIASRITSTLDITNQASHTLTSSQVAALIQLLRDDDHIKPPSAKCLSPAGEYNMRLGLLKDYTIVEIL
jgi:DNA topoisomerase VI subunit B